MRLTVSAAVVLSDCRLRIANAWNALVGASTAAHGRQRQVHEWSHGSRFQSDGLHALLLTTRPVHTEAIESIIYQNSMHSIQHQRRQGKYVHGCIT